MKQEIKTKQPLEDNYVQWFMNKPVEERISLSDKYYPESHDIDLEDEEIERIYLAENNIQPIPDSKEGLHTQDEPRFNYQEVDELDNLPDLQKWVDGNKLNALVDEEKGGIIGYIHHEHIDEIVGLLNERKALLDALRDALATLIRWQESDAWDDRDDETYKNILTAINNAKNI